MTEDYFIPQEMAKRFVNVGFDGGTENVTQEKVMRWLRKDKAVHINIQPTLERDGSVKYFCKSIIDHTVELTFKKKKFDEYEQCVDSIIQQLSVALR